MGKRSRQALEGGRVKNHAHLTVPKKIRCKECRKTSTLFRHKKDPKARNPRKARGQPKTTWCAVCQRITQHEEL